MDIQDIDKLLNETESLQKEMHEFINELFDKAKEENRKITYQDAKDIFYFMKISQLQKELKVMSYDTNN